MEETFSRPLPLEAMNGMLANVVEDFVKKKFGKKHWVGMSLRPNVRVMDGAGGKLPFIFRMGFDVNLDGQRGPHEGPLLFVEPTDEVAVQVLARHTTEEVEVGTIMQYPLPVGYPDAVKQAAMFVQMILNTFQSSAQDEPTFIESIYRGLKTGLDGKISERELRRQIGTLVNENPEWRRNFPSHLHASDVIGMLMEKGWIRSAGSYDYRVLRRQEVTNE